jgi:cytochrome P450
VIIRGRRSDKLAAFTTIYQEIRAMTSVYPPVVSYPLPMSAIPIEPAPELLALARQAPVLQTSLPGNTTGWLVTGFEQVREVLADPRFSRALAASPGREKRGIEFISAESLLGLDPPEHTRLRKLVAGTFTARRMQLLVPQIAAIADDLIDRMLAGPRPADLVSAFSLPLPVQVICQMLGVPPSDQDRFHAWSDALVGDWARDQGEMAAALEALCAYIAELIAAKRAQPADDLVSALIAARDEEDRMSEDELVHMCIAVLLGGHETTANMISLSLITLLGHPAQLARLRADPALLPGAVEEMIRYVQLSVSLPPARVTTEEVTLGGVTIPAGAMVFSLFGIANRDPAVFPDPDTFDITRPPGSHLGFGVGAHHCLGAQLARVELQEAFRGLLGRLPGLRLAVGVDQLRFKENMTITSVKELPVTWDS